jgi:hypothetical protein
MSRVDTLLSMTTHRLALSSGVARIPIATAVTQSHAIAGLVVVVIFAGICISLVSKVNSALVSLVAQLIETAAAVGRILMLLVVFGVVAVLLLIHV